MIVFALGFWLLVAVAWLTFMPKELKAKNWHYIHALVPFVPLVIYYISDNPALKAPLELFIIMGGVFFAIMTLLWMIGEKLTNHSFMDIGYSTSVLLVVAFCLLQSSFPEGLGLRHLITFVMVALWSGRLLRHTIRTNLKVEVQPYVALRQRYGERWKVWSFFHVYMLQGALIWVWTISFAFIMSSEQKSLGALDLVGIGIWLVGYLFQAIGDYQLEMFKKDPANKGALMQKGLWSLTRHPNYFGESVMWAGFFVMALSQPWGWLAVVSPLYVAWFMGYGSAAPGNEKHLRKTRPEYQEYAQRVPQFFPKFPSNKK